MPAKFIQTIGCKISPDKKSRYLKIMQEIRKLTSNSRYFSDFQVWCNDEDPAVYLERYEFKSKEAYDQLAKDKKELEKFIPWTTELGKIVSQKEIQQNGWKRVF